MSPDYSKQGMGWILQQKKCSCVNVTPTCCPAGWSLVLAGGKFCNKAEQNYSPVEGEAMAVAKGLEDTRYYTLGCKDLYVATDHSSLVSILGNQSLADVQNPRLASTIKNLVVAIQNNPHSWQETVSSGCTLCRLLISRMTAK